MALTVRTNVGALSAIKTLNNTQNSLTKSLGRVSSGSESTKQETMLLVYLYLQE